MPHSPPFLAVALRSLASLVTIPGYHRLIRLMFSPNRNTFPFDICQDGLRWIGNTKEYVFWHTYFLGSYENTLLHAMCKYVMTPQRGALLDIGGNLGTTAVQCASSFEYVHSFEPNHALHESFCTLIQANDVTNVHLHPVALGDQDRMATLTVFNAHNSGTGSLLNDDILDKEHYTTVVEVRQAERYVEEHVNCSISAIKLDVQGYEAAILRSLANVIRRERPILYVEVTAPATRAAVHPATFAERFGYSVRAYTTRRSRWFGRSQVIPIAEDQWAGFEGDALLVPTFHNAIA